MQNKQKLSAYKNQDGVDFVAALAPIVNQENLIDLVAMYVCAMHPTYRVLPSSFYYDDEIEMVCFNLVKKNAKPIGCIVANDKHFDINDIDSDKYQQMYIFSGTCDELCPQPDKRSFAEQMNKKLFLTNQRIISRIDLFNFAKQNYGNGLLVYIDENFYF